MKELKILGIILAVFLTFYFVPFSSPVVTGAVGESLLMTQDYARNHVILCLLPAFFIAGAISVFIRQQAVLKYLGAKANKVLSYGVASVSGTILAVCSCTVLPLFAGIYTRGAGIGPATAFLYAGPAINVLAIILTARVLGMEIGIARAGGAIVFSIIIGLLMHLIFKDSVKKDAVEETPESEEKGVGRPLWKDTVFFGVMVAILVFMNWSRNGACLCGSVDNIPELVGWQGDGSFLEKAWQFIFLIKWYISAVLFAVLGGILYKWFSKEELKDWVLATWGFAKQIFPLLIIGVLSAGFLLGRPGHEGIIPSSWIASLVGGNSIFANFFASIVGAFMYIATLTEVPILQGLIGSGMGKGPALTLLLAGPALSLQSMLILNTVMGFKKTFVYVALVVVMSTLTGFIYGLIF